MSGRLKVLQVGKFYPPYKGGMESHLHLLCSKLKMFVDVSVIVANTRRETERSHLDGVLVSRVGHLCQVARAPICPSMVKEIRSSEADIIHIHLPNPTALVAYWLSGHRGRLVLTYHSDTIRQQLLTKVFDPILEQLIHRASAVLCASPNIIDHSPVLSRWRDRCRVVPFGIDVAPFEEDYSNDVLRIHSQFGKRLVLAVGRLVYYKGFEYLIDAMANVDANLIIIGQGSLKDSLLRRVRELGIADRVTILDKIENAIPYYQAAKVFALSSVERTEAFGIVQLEAMACGIPVVNTSVQSGVPFVSLHNVTGFTVPPRDPDELAKALNTILQDTTLASSLGVAARRRVRTEFSVHGMISRVLDAYQDATSSGAHGWTATKRFISNAKE